MPFFLKKNQNKSIYKLILYGCHLNEVEALNEEAKKQNKNRIASEVNPLCWTEMFQQSYHF